MATINEIIAKRNELQATNPNATNVDARKALTPAPVAPVAWVPPAITPTTPTPVIHPTTPQVTWVDGQKFTQAPVDPTTGPSTPITPNVQPTPTTPKTDATPWITQTDFQKAQAESEKIKVQNESQMALNNQQADLKTKERQQMAEEAKIASTPTDMQGILSSMVAGVPVAPQKTGNYINAKFQYDQYSKFNAMTPTQLLDNLKQGQIGTEMDKLLSQNPSYIQAKTELDKVQKTNSINNNIRTIYGGVTGAESTTPDYLTKASDDLINKLGLDQDQTSAEAFSEYVTWDQNIVNYTNQLSSVNRQIADTAKLINDGIKELKWRKWDMPADALVVLLNSTFKDVNETLTNLNNTKTYLEADLKNATEMAKARYDAVSKDIENNRTIKNSVISNLIQSQFSLAEKMTENDMADQIARESMNDPYKAIPAMIEEYKKLGIPFTRSTQQIIQDFESSGKDLATYLSELQGTIQSKPEYQRMQDIQMGQLSDAEKLQAQYDQQTAMQDRTFSQQLAMNDVNFNQDIQKMMTQYDMSQASWVTEFKRDLIKWGMSSEQADAIVRNETGNWNWVTGEKLIYADDGTFIKSTLKNTTNPNGWIECAEYVSKMVGSRVGSTWEDKKKLNNEENGTIGSIAVWQPVKTWELAKYGHAGIIVGEDWDNWIIKSANYNVDGRISTDTIQKSEIEGYRTTKLGDTLSGWQNKEALSLAQNIMDGIWSLTDLTPTARKDVLPELDRIIKAKSTDDKNRNMILKSAISTKEVDATSLQKLKDMETVKFQMSTIAKNLASQYTWPIIGKIREFNPWDTEAQVALAQLAGLTPKVARGIFWEVWVLTDADLENYQKALPNLKSTEEKNKLVVDFMTKLLAEWYKNSLVQEAKAGRNVANYIDDYDSLVGQTWTAPKPTISWSDLKTELSNLFKK